MRGTISKEQLQFDPEIEKTARRNNAKTKEVKRLARLAQQSGSSSSFPRESPRGSPQLSPPPSPSSVDEEDIIGMERQQHLPPPEIHEVENALPCWTSPRRLARLGGQTTRQVEMKSSTINLITNHPFSGLDHENPYQHLTTFYELAGSVGASEEEEEAVFCRLFPHSLIGKAKQWYLDQSTALMLDWNALEKAFYERFFPEDRHMDAKTAVAMFSQGVNESLCEAWERYKSLLRNCPKNGFDSQMQIYLFRQGLQGESKNMLDAASSGSLMLKTPSDAVKIIDQMALNTRKSSHNRNPSQRKAGILELESSDALLAQIEALQKGTKDMPKQILEQLKKDQGTLQVNACELCFGDHPTGCCPPPCEEEVNFVGNQQRPPQQQGQQAGSSSQGQFPGNSNQGRYPGNNNFPRGNQFGQPWRQPPPNYYYYPPPPPNYYQQPYYNQYQYPPQNNPQQQNRPQSTDETLNQFMQMSMATQKSNEASIKNLETQVGQMAQHMSQANQQGGAFTANTQDNPKGKEHCKAITQGSGKAT